MNNKENKRSKEYRRADSAGTSTLLSKKGDPHDILIGELGEKFKEYRQKWDRSGKCRVVQDFPLHLDIELSFTCNLRCGMCVFSLPMEERKKWGDLSKTLSYKTYRRIIDEGAQHGLCSVDFNVINEPLLQRDLAKFVKYAKKKDIVDIMFNTNALLLTEERSKELIEAGLTRIMFSLDAIRDATYKRIRIGSDFRKVMRNINRFVEIKKRLKKRLPITRVSFLVNKINCAEMNEFIDYWKDRVDFFSIQNFSNPFVGAPCYKECEEMFRIPGSDFDPNFICPQPFQRLLIRNSGNVIPCCSWYGVQNVVGNIHQDTIHDIWNGKKIRAFRKAVNAERRSQPAACRRCRFSLNPEKALLSKKVKI
ncbi:radical SAM/SPASM domain-containing protein [Candidatus Omnitrophota bacterium]